MPSDGQIRFPCTYFARLVAATVRLFVAGIRTSYWQFNSPQPPLALTPTSSNSRHTSRQVNWHCRSLGQQWRAAPVFVSYARMLASYATVRTRSHLQGRGSRSACEGSVVHACE